MELLNLFRWLVFLCIVVAIYQFLAKIVVSKDKSTWICPHCGTQGEPKTIIKGSFSIEIILWICFLLPGLIYSIWRLSSRYPGCPSCEQPGMISINSPNGRLLAKKFENI